MMTMNESAMRYAVLKFLTPLSKAAGQITDPFVTRRVTFQDVNTATPLLMPGDGLLSRKRLELSNLGISGHFKHAAIVSPDPKVIIEAVGYGVIASTVDDFFLPKDEVVVLRPNFADEAQRLAAAQWAAGKVGLPYDFEFTQSLTAFFCSKLLYDSYDVTMGTGGFIPALSMGIPTPQPQDFITSTWDVIFLSARGSLT